MGPDETAVCFSKLTGSSGAASVENRRVVLRPWSSPVGHRRVLERTRLRLGVLDRQTGAPFDVAVVGLQPGAVRGASSGPSRLWNGVTPAATSDYVREFVEELLRTGIMLSDLLGDLIESLPDDAYPGECNAEVVLEMLIGSVRPVVDAAGKESVRSAVALIAATSDRTLTDLRRAVELASRGDCGAGGKRHGGRRHGGRRHGGQRG